MFITVAFAADVVIAVVVAVVVAGGGRVGTEKVAEIITILI